MGRRIKGKELEEYDRIYGHEKPMKITHAFEIYRGRKKEWRWRLRATNGKVVADSGEGYQRRSAMMRTVRGIEHMFLDGSFEIKDLK